MREHSIIILFYVHLYVVRYVKAKLQYQTQVPQILKPPEQLKKCKFSSSSSSTSVVAVGFSVPRRYFLIRETGLPSPASAMQLLKLPHEHNYDPASTSHFLRK